MPIVINEIEISVEVSNEGAGGSANAQSANDNALKERIISECVEKVMEIMNLKNER